MTNPPLWKASIALTKFEAGDAAAALELDGSAQAVLIVEEPFAEGAVVEALYTEEPDAAYLSRISGCTVIVAPLPDQDWIRLSQEGLPPVRAGRFFVYGAHDAGTVPHGVIAMKIEAGLAFGTGHHETTLQMAEQLLGLSVEGLSVLDMGCGTGVLAILASLKGAKSILAIDNDPIASNSATENFEINEITGEVICGDAKDIQGLSFDLILANINRNILINDMAAYAASLVKGGTILFSGFYEEDLSFIKQAASENGLVYQMHSAKNNWVVAKFNKAI